jgi:hypothetical protein
VFSAPTITTERSATRSLVFDEHDASLVLGNAPKGWWQARQHLVVKRIGLAVRHNHQACNFGKECNRLCGVLLDSRQTKGGPFPDRPCLG